MIGRYDVMVSSAGAEWGRKQQSHHAHEAAPEPEGKDKWAQRPNLFRRRLDSGREGGKRTVRTKSSMQFVSRRPTCFKQCREGSRWIHLCGAFSALKARFPRKAGGGLGHWKVEPECIGKEVSGSLRAHMVTVYMALKAT